MEATQKNLASYWNYLELCSYWNYLELCNILRDTIYKCPFCDKEYIYVKCMFNHLENEHNYYGFGL